MFIKTGVPEFDDLLPRVKGFLEQDILEAVVDGDKIRGFRSPDAKSIWIRDHSDMMRAGKYFETDLKSTVEHFAATQSANGRIFDYFTVFPEKLPCERENWTKYVRVPVEADVEYRFIKAAYLAWQATGDDTWILRLIPAMERALDYIFNNPQRLDAETGLVKRAYTIDTWDFAYTAGKHEWLQFQINDDTYWGVFHGDNSGYYESLSILATLYEYFGEGLKATESRRKAEILKKKVQEICWNGEYFTHFVKITPVEIPGVDEARQLSMANPMSINRGIATHEMAVSIIKEYQRRKISTQAFAEWFSIDPPFPDGVFGDDKLIGGAYINGGIFPLAGGELAMAAFNHGFEEYGVSVLKQYYNLIAEKNETFLWYFPDGSPTTVETSTSPEAMPTDGWGSSAMVWALVEGLAGIEDKLKRFEKVRLSPRWLAAGVRNAGIEAGYLSQGVGYTYNYTDDALSIDLKCHADVDFHVLINSAAIVNELTVNGLLIEYQVESVEQSQYVNFSARVEDHAHIRITFKG